MKNEKKLIAFPNIRIFFKGNYPIAFYLLRAQTDNHHDDYGDPKEQYGKIHVMKLKKN